MSACVCLKDGMCEELHTGKRIELLDLSLKVKQNVMSPEFVGDKISTNNRDREN